MFDKLSILKLDSEKQSKLSRDNCTAVDMKDMNLTGEDIKTNENPNSRHEGRYAIFMETSETSGNIDLGHPSMASSPQVPVFNYRLYCRLALPLTRLKNELDIKSA